jgi:copper transport protein
MRGLIVLCAFGFTAVMPCASYAHGVLLTSTPGAQQRLSVAPSEIVLTFNESVGPVFVRVVGGTGQEVGRPGPIRLDGNALHLPLRERLPKGNYVVTYRVVSSDTHTIGGAYVFAVAEPVAARNEIGVAALTKSSPWAIVVALTRAVHYASVLLAVGSALFLLWLRIPDAIAAVTRLQGLWAAGMAAIAYVLAIPWGGAEMIWGSPAAFSWPAAWAMGAKSTLMPSALLGLPGALMLAFAFALAQRGVLLWMGTALVLASFLITGHAATAQPVGLMATSIALHLICGGFWFAALVPLIRAVRICESSVATAVLVQFSTRAMWTVVALFVSGLVVSVVQVHAVDKLWATAYGQRLVAKIGLFLVLLALASANKLVFTQAVARADARGTSRFRNSMRVEYALMIGIVTVAASLTLVPPPRALLAEDRTAATAMPDIAAGVFRTSAVTAGYAIDIEITPARRGHNVIVLKFSDSSGAPVNMRSSHLGLSLPTASIEHIEVKGEPMTPGMYRFVTNEIVVSGEWQMRIEASVDDFNTLAVDVPVQVH